MRVVLVGATGAVGTQMLSILEQRNFPLDELVPVASARSAGRLLSFRDDSHEVVPLTASVFDGADIAFFDVPDEVSKQWAPVAAGRGAVVIDKSAAWRTHPEVPLVVPEVNPQDASNRPLGIIASPNCTTLTIVIPLYALHERWGLRRLVLASYQAASGAGKAGTDELWDQTERIVKDRDAAVAGLGREVLEAGPTFKHPISFNVVPQCGSIRDEGYTSEEIKLSDESRKIMGLPDLHVTATCVRVPVVVGHSVAVHAEFDEEVSAEEARSILSVTEGVELRDRIEDAVYPTPLEAAGTDPCYVGRIRRDRLDPRALEMFCVADNLRKGAALNTVQVAELLT
ncbi:MAG TPA: aspartate-semialdehyde dehydrogenase [Actinomycetota bacterium]|jgi:aspartate-semialdehyde dehydrogenase|nr:aspartate-semialdehyde dehydrogenase [Actinomycetota bacterium]